MKELTVDRAKIIISEHVPNLEIILPLKAEGRKESLWKFTRLLLEAEVPTIDLIHQVGTQSSDLVHLSGLHRLGSRTTCKADELRHFWGQLWQTAGLLQSLSGLREYIADVCEVGYKASRGRHAYRLFIGMDNERRPWRTPEWYEARKPVRLPIEPLSEFYPYITKRPTEEHDFLMAVDSLVPKYLPNATRADVCQDMIVAILSGDVTLDNLKDGLPKYLKMFMKGAPSKYGHLSLDGPAGGNDTRTLGQALGL